MTAERALGPFTVRAAAADAAVFAREIGGDERSVPFTFPVRWLARPDFQDAAADLIGNRDWVPIHESQSFDYRTPLALDTDYEMSVIMRRETEPSRIVLVAAVGKTGEAAQLGMEMVLRIVPLPAGRPA